MPYSSAEKRRAYLACRAIFTGNNAQLRKPKKIRELLDAHKSTLSPLMRDCGTDKVLHILKNLLEQDIFKSQVKAKIEFPELFQSSPARDVQRTASENDAAHSEAAALEEIASLEDMGNEEDGDDIELVKELSEIAEVAASPIEQELDSMPSLYPSYLPYHVQHLILTTAQRVLEECCFKFAETWLPSILKSHGWDCAEAVELTKWTRILAKRSPSAKLPMHALKLSGSTLQDVLFATNNLRHTAVHRLPTTARGISQLIQSAVKLAEALQDPQRTAQLEELHYEIDSKVKAMELNKNVLEDSLSRELQEIHRKREELDRKEKDLIAGALTEDLENKLLIGLLLEESVKSIFTEQGRASEELEKDRNDAEVSEDEDEINGCSLTADGAAESVELV